MAASLDEIRTGPPTVTVGTAAGCIGISKSYAYELIHRGDFPCRVIKVGTRYRVPRTALVALLDQVDAAAG